MIVLTKPLEHFSFTSAVSIELRIESSVFFLRNVEEIEFKITFIRTQKY